MKSYKGYKLINLKCMMLDIPMISRAFEGIVDVAGHDDDIEWVTNKLKDFGKVRGLEVLEFEVIKG